MKITQSLREGLAGTAFRRTNCETGPKTALSMTVNILVSENTVHCYVLICVCQNLIVQKLKSRVFKCLRLSSPHSTSFTEYFICSLSFKEYFVSSLSLILPHAHDHLQP